MPDSHDVLEGIIGAFHVSEDIAVHRARQRSAHLDSLNLLAPKDDVLRPGIGSIFSQFQ